MTQEEKQLLLKDLCARLPYGVNIRATFLSFTEDKLETRDIELTYYNAGYLDEHWIEAKPYLRPMSSMTEEERKELSDKAIELELDYLAQNDEPNSIKGMMSSTYQIDWLNAHHFDYRGLIEKGLAIAVTEENNPYK